MPTQIEVTQDGNRGVQRQVVFPGELQPISAGKALDGSNSVMVVICDPTDARSVLYEFTEPEGFVPEDPHAYYIEKIEEADWGLELTHNEPFAYGLELDDAPAIRMVFKHMLLQCNN